MIYDFFSSILVMLLFGIFELNSIVKFMGV